MTPAVALPKQSSAGAGLIAEVDRVLALCMSERCEPSVDYEIEQLHLIRSALEKAYPESWLADNIVIGAFAAKNIADWNPDLADALMDLDYKLRSKIAA